MDSQEKVWDAIAVDWNVYRTKISPSVENFLRGKEGSVLDLGCGSGRNFINNGMKWYGVDFSKEMLRFAEKKNYFELRKSCGGNLDYEDEFFDYVICVAVLHCIEGDLGRRKVVEEIFRVLKKGGEALICCWGKNSVRLRNKKKEDFVSWTRKGDGVISKSLRYNYIFDLNELVEICEDVGFEVLRNWEERNVNVIVKKVF